MDALITKIALIQTVRPYSVRPDIGLGVGFIKSYLEMKAPGKYVIDIYESEAFFNVGIYNVHKYDLIGISSVSNQFNIAQNIASIVKESRKYSKLPLIVIGGAHISSLPESISSLFDYGVIGEGEQTFFELIEALNLELSDDEILKISGIVAQRAEKIIFAPKRSLIKNIDQIPFPQRDYFNKYRAVPSLITARGCPYRCAFCTNTIIWGENVRINSPKRVLEELIEMKKI